MSKIDLWTSFGVRLWVVIPDSSSNHHSLSEKSINSCSRTVNGSASGVSFEYQIEDGSRAAEPGQNTIAFCSGVASEQIRMLVRYLVGEDWWHNDAPKTGLWAFEHRFVEAKIEPFEHPDQCIHGCEFTHRRLGRGESGRPRYPPIYRRTTIQLEGSNYASIPAVSYESGPRNCGNMHLKYLLGVRLVTSSLQSNSISVGNNSCRKKFQKSFFFNQTTSLSFFEKIFFQQKFNISLNCSDGFA